MSIVSYHARVDGSLLGALQTDPDLFCALPRNAGPAEAELLFIDKDWQALSWLLSAKAREEQKHEAVQFALMRRKDGAEKPDKLAWEAAKAREASELGIELVDTKLMPDDPALIAIEGRGPRDARLAELGYGGRVFVPTEVANLTAALDRITEADMRAHFDPQAMEDFDVAGILWTEEEPDVLDAILIPIFNGLKAFYGRAARAGQYVLVVHG
ncbi:MAG TPA: DUF1877 family protein [Alphaproteobacteria bacterium]|nr:DUF1877 family protein [Alphaproteobacteria bacterium]